MNCLSQVRSYITVTVFRKTCHIISRSGLDRCYHPHWKSNLKLAGMRTLHSGFLPTLFLVHSYSTRRKVARPRKLDPVPVVENEKNAFFLVRKGDIVGIYKSLSDCQAQVGSSVFDPPVSVYKGQSLPKDAEEDLASYGFKKALYIIKASDLKEDLFGMLTPCLFQEPTSEVKSSSEEDTLWKRSQDILETETGRPCIIEFDGASKGNPGLAGAAAGLRTEDGSLICKLRQGMGIATNNAAEYQGRILGLKYALEKGYTNIHVKGDSKLVCMQLQDLWKVKHKTMSQLYNEAKKLGDKCMSFKISHVLREFNSDADAEPNLAARLAGDPAFRNWKTCEDHKG